MSYVDNCKTTPKLRLHMNAAFHEVGVPCSWRARRLSRGVCAYAEREGGRRSYQSHSEYLKWKKSAAWQNAGRTVRMPRSHVGNVETRIRVTSGQVIHCRLSYVETFP